MSLRRTCVLWLVAVTIPAPLLFAPPAAAGARRPNILVIVSDDQRPGTFVVMDATRKRWRQRGIAYRQAYVSSPLCCPSRASILTGQYPHNHGVKTNALSSKLRGRTTVQRWLDDAGYRTAIFGKFLNHWRGAPPFFDWWSIYHRKPRYYHAKFRVNGRIREPPGYSTDFITESAVTHLERLERIEDNDPWFLYVTPFGPHYPSLPAVRHRRIDVPSFNGNPATREEDLSDKPPFVRRTREGTARWARRTRKRQLRTLLSVDDLVRKMDRTLHRLHESSNTLMIFTSDNGLAWGEHGMRGRKTAAYEPNVRVPLMLRWPGVFPEGVVSHRLVSNIDIAPTIYDAVGVSDEVTTRVDGRSLLDESWERDEVLVQRARTGGNPVPPWTGLRSSTIMYAEYRLDPVFSEYYDLVADRWELENLLHNGDPSDDPDEAALHERLKDLRDCAGTVGLNACS